jgi:hypothetical protein
MRLRPDLLEAAGGLTVEDRAVLDEWAPGWDA